GVQLLSARMTLEASPTRPDCAARPTFLQPIEIFARDAFPATSSVPQRPRLECASQDGAHLEVEVGFVMMQTHPQRSIRFEWQLAGQHLIEDNSKCIKIGAPIELIAQLAFRLFRRHVFRRTNDDPGLRRRESAL